MGIGVKDELSILASQSNDKSKLGEKLASQNLKEIQRFLTRNSREFIFCFLSYDVQVDVKQPEFPQIHFLVPDRLHILQERQICKDFVEGIHPGKNKYETLTVKDFDTEKSKLEYRSMIEATLNLLRTETTLDRITLAREILLPHDCLPRLRLADNRDVKTPFTKKIYWRKGENEFCSCNPEVLAIGDSSNISTLKLSGTLIDESIPQKNHRINLNDLTKKLFFEHSSSIEATIESLRPLGKSKIKESRIITWNGISHIGSIIQTKISADRNIGDILVHLPPTGMSDNVIGSKILSSSENFVRGPYYGIVGFISPEEKLFLLQNIRSTFRTSNKSYSIVGAAITKDSNPHKEMVETELKANSISL